MDVDFDWVANNADRNGNGFVLRNNTIENHRARGMLIKASDGIIEGNLINGSTLGGIIITPELSWGEADFVRNVVVANNRVMNVGYGKQSYGAIALGATAPVRNHVSHLNVGNMHDMSNGLSTRPPFDTGRGHRNVSLINNTVSQIETWGLWITSSTGVIVKDNTFIARWLVRVSSAKGLFGSDVETQYSRNITACLSVYTHLLTGVPLIMLQH
jgi:hypothetical protein